LAIPFFLFFFPLFLLGYFRFAPLNTGKTRPAAAAIDAVLRGLPAEITPGGTFERVSRVMLRQLVLSFGPDE
jgi:hypothetical protein